jgi:hypothetical protein
MPLRWTEDRGEATAEPCSATHAAHHNRPNPPSAAPMRDQPLAHGGPPRAPRRLTIEKEIHTPSALLGLGQQPWLLQLQKCNSNYSTVTTVAGKEWRLTIQHQLHRAGPAAALRRARRRIHHRPPRPAQRHIGHCGTHTHMCDCCHRHLFLKETRDQEGSRRIKKDRAGAPHRCLAACPATKPPRTPVPQPHTRHALAHTHRRTRA